MAHPYVVRTVVFPSGERFLVLLDHGSGTPLFDPTLFAVTALRGRNRATATIEQALRAVSVLHVFLDASGIDLPARLQEGLTFRTSRT